MPYLRSQPAIIPLVALLILAGATAGVLGGPALAQQPETRIGIDADTSGNTDTALGAIDECVEISEGESHEIDIFVEDVTDLLAWEAIISFEPAVLQIVDEDVQLFMAANEGSDVQDFSGELPDSDGRYWLQTFDAADPLALDSGSGVLARVTVQGVGPGVSELRLPLLDVDGDGQPDVGQGPLLQGVGENGIDVVTIGDVNGDSLFDGPIGEARIAVDASCSDPLGPAAQTASEGGDEGDSIGAITVIVIVVGGIASVSVGGLAAAWAVRRRPSPEG
jgi:hypothetical protein